MHVTPQELVELFKLIGQEANSRRSVGIIPTNPKVDAPIPVPSTRTEGYELIVQTLEQRYPQGTFTTADAKAAVKKALGKRSSTCGYAIGWGVKNKLLRRIRQGVYSFASQRPYEPSQDSVTDIVSNDFKTLQSVFKILSSIRENHFLTIDREQGITARFSDRDSLWQADLVIRKELFETFYCKSRAVRVALSYGEIAKIMGANRLEPFHLKVPNDSHIEVGGMGNEHRISVLECKASDDAIEPKVPLPVVSGRCSIEITRELLFDILRNAILHSNRLAISCESDRVTFSSIQQAGLGYAKEVLGGPDTKISCEVPAKVVYDVRELFPLIRAAEVQKFRLQFDTTVLKVGIPIHDAVNLDFYLAPIREESIKAG